MHGNSWSDVTMMNITDDFGGYSAGMFNGPISSSEGRNVVLMAM
jgi:hypothetical protein